MASPGKNYSLRDRDLGWNRAKRAMKGLGKSTVDVGVLDEHNARSDEVGNIMLMLVHEFGIGVPERSVIRATIDKNKRKYINLIKTLARFVLFGQMGKEQALTIIGAKVEADMKARVRAGLQPSLKEATKKGKKSSTPLIDTGQLLSSLDYRVNS